MNSTTHWNDFLPLNNICCAINHSQPFNARQKGDEKQSIKLMNWIQKFSHRSRDDSKILHLFNFIPVQLETETAFLVGCSIAIPTHFTSYGCYLLLSLLELIITTIHLLVFDSKSNQNEMNWITSLTLNIWLDRYPSISI